MELVQSLVKEKEQLQLKVAELSENNIVLEKVAIENEEKYSSAVKEAKNKEEFFPKEKIKQTVDRLVKLSYISPVYSEQMVEEIEKDPNTVLSLLEKISEASVSLPNSGVGIAKESSVTDVDPDGWTRLRS
jgi:hypothetical protein